MYLRIMSSLLHFLPDFGCALRRAPNFFEIHPRGGFHKSWTNQNLGESAISWHKAQIHYSELE
jgi:hypothetical protein